MSVAARKQDSPRLPAPYLSVDTAAALLGCVPRYIRMRCAEVWEANGLAKKFGNVWGVHPGADRRLRADAQQARQDLEVIAQLEAEGCRPESIKLGKAKRDILREFDSFRSGASTLALHRKQYVSHVRASGVLKAAGIKRFSARTLRRWKADYAEHGFRGLVRKVRADCTEYVNGEAAIQYVFDLVNAGNRITLTDAIRMARGEAVRHHKDDPAWRLGGYTSIRVEIDKRRPKILKMIADKGERAAKGSCVPKAQRDYEAVPANSVAVGDERTLDVWCRVWTARGWKAVRAKITAWLDMRSRMVTGWTLEAYADSNTILGSLKKAIRKHGKPDRLLVDWGKDYRKATGHVHTSRHRDLKRFDGDRIGSVLDELGIEVSFAMPYTPWSKSIESFFKTMKNTLDKLFVAFWGGCPSERHEDRQRYVSKNLEKLVTLDELRDAIAGFIDIYHRTPHTAADMFGKSPLEAMERFRDGAARYESEAVLDHLFQDFIGPRTVRRDGIQYRGYWYGRGDPRVVTLQGKKVLLAMQPDDAGHAMVCDLNRTPKFRIECQSLKGFTRREAAEVAQVAARTLRPYRKQARDSRKKFANTPRSEMLANRLAGLEVEHGRCVPDEQTAPSLIIRPALEEALKEAGPAPVEAVSRAVRTGTTDDVITIEDMLAPDILDERASEPGDEPIDFFGLNDPGGDDV